MESNNDLLDELRARGLRVTPQRRAILSVFTHRADEHLSADEIHAHASAVVPEISRGTVYSTLAELTELGVLAGRGSPEPVRYETNTAPHQHFRCRLCQRTYDVEIPEPDTRTLTRAGHVAERIDMTAEGVCAECADYDKGLHAGAARARSQASPQLPDGLAGRATATPLGTIFTAASAQGLVRAVFENHTDAPEIAELIKRRRGGRAAREHLLAADAAITAYFAGEPLVECPIDWTRLEDAVTLRAAQGVARGNQTSYNRLDVPAAARERGESFGANPLVLFVPCHRVTRGREIPTEYVGGAERRAALVEFERS